MATRQDLQNLITSWFTIQQPSWQQVSWTSVSTDTNIWDIINSESTEKRNMKISDQINKLMQKHQTRLNMAKWKVSSGDKRMDKLEDARSSLADYARSAYLEEAKKDNSMDLGVLENMKDGDIIDWMTKDSPEAKQKFVNFVNNWWFVKDVYNDIMWIDEEAIKEQERKDAWRLANFWWALVSELPKQIWWAMDLLWVSDWFNQKDKERLEKYNQVSNKEYEKFKRGEVSFDELKDKWVSWIYLDYENDVNNWTFKGSLEDYAKAMYDKQIWETEKSIQQKMEEWLPRDYDPEWKWTWLGKFVPQMIEFAMLPWSKWKWLRNTLLWTAEILWLNTLSEWKLPTKWEAATTALLTAAIDWVLRIPWWYKAIRSAVGRVEPEVKEALWNTTLKQRKENADVIKKWLTATKKKATEILGKAAKWINKKKWEAWEALWKIRKNMEWDFKYQDFFDSINAEFKKFETEWWWGKNTAPEIKIDKAGNMEIYNEDALSNVTDANWIKLLDYIKSEWNAFRNQGRADNIQNAERFMEDLNAKIYEAIEKKGINRNDSAVKSLLNAVKNWYEKLYTSMWEDWQIFKKAREDFSNMDTYAKFFEKYIWKLKEGKKWADALNELEKEMSLWEKWFGKWWDYIWEFLKILKSNNIVEEDLSSQLISLIHAFWIKNSKQLQELIEAVYPSIPWIREVWLELWRKWMKSAEAKSMLKDAPIQTSDIWAAISNAVRPATQVWEERMLEY